jgi:hypothetical protein
MRSVSPILGSARVSARITSGITSRRRSAGTDSDAMVRTTSAPIATATISPAVIDSVLRPSRYLDSGS